MAYQSVNPYDGQVIRTVKGFTDEQVELALQKTEQCFGDWKRASFDHRARLSVALARSFKIVDPDLKNPMSQQWEGLQAVRPAAVGRSPTARSCRVPRPL